MVPQHLAPVTDRSDRGSVVSASTPAATFVPRSAPLLRRSLVYQRGWDEQARFRGERRVGREDVVGLRIDGEPHGRDGRQAKQEGFGDAVPAVHQAAIGGQDDRVAQVSLEDAAGVLGDGATGRL